MKRKLFLAAALFAAVVLFVAMGTVIAASAQQKPILPTTSPGFSQTPTGQPVPLSPASPLSPLGSGFTYQGRLTSSSSPANGQYDLVFTLDDALTGGNQVSTPITLTNQTVTDGLFTVTLDFGAAFQGAALWMEIAVRQTGGGAFTTLSPRQALTAAPYAMSLMPGAVVSGATGPGGIMLQVNNSTGNAVAGFTGSASDSAVYGVNSHITSTLGVGVKGQGYYTATGVEGASTYGYGMYGHSFVGPGVYGNSLNAAGGYFTSTNGSGLFATSTYSEAIHGQTQSSHAAVSGSNTGSPGGPGTYGESTSADGVYGFSHAPNFAGVAGVHDGAVGGNGVAGVSPSGTGVYGSGSTGGYFTSTNGTGVYSFGGSSGMSGNSTNGTGVDGNSSSGTGIYGYSITGTGTYGQSTSGYGVRGFSSGNTAVSGVTNSTNPAVSGLSTASGGIGTAGEADTGSSAKGVYGYSTSGYGVYGFSAGQYGVYGTSSAAGTGVYGTSASGIGVVGTSSSGVGVYAQGGTGGDGVQAFTGAATHSAVAGISTSSVAGNGVYGTSTNCANCYAGYFDGRVRAVGGCCNGPMLNTQIDDPLDPANKYLNQSAVESPDMKNVYDGNVTTNAKGQAIIALPAYVETLNRDFRYQLTVVGQFAQAIVATRIKDNSFTIKTDKPNVDVSWQVTGIRQDPYANAHRIPVEQDKPTGEKGYYLQPELYGQPATKSVDIYQRNSQSNPLQATPVGGK